MNWLNNLLRNPSTHEQEPLARSAPRPDDVPQVWAAAMSEVADEATAFEWMANLADEERLAAIAVHARFADVRLAAAQRLQSDDALEQVARLSRSKDKGVFRHCSELLRQRRQNTAREERASRLTQELTALLEHAPLAVSTLLDLQEQRRDLGDACELTAPCDALLERAQARLKEESDGRRALQISHSEAAELATLLTDVAWPDAETIARVRASLPALSQAHAQLPQWLAEKASAQSLAASLRVLESRLGALDADEERVQACEHFLGEHGGNTIDAPLEQAWEALAKPDRPSARAAVQLRWEAMAAPAEPAAGAEPTVAAVPPEPVAAPSAPVPRADPAAVRPLLEDLEKALEQGHLHDAEEASRKLKALIAGTSLHGHLAARLQRAHARLNELHGWAKWGTKKKREELIGAAEALRDGAHDVDHLAWAVPDLREQWKQVNHQAMPQAEWERFDSALEKAFAPVLAQRAEETAARARARAHKQALCDQWEAALAQIDWLQPDFASIEATRQRMFDEWRAAAHAAFRDERKLQTRFRTLIGSIDQRFADARAAEVRRREQLIEAAEALSADSDMRRSTDAAKVLQERWRGEAGPLRISQSDERKLWTRFRAACNVVFERRDARRAERANERQQQQQASQALLDAFAAVMDVNEAEQIKSAAGRFRTDWAAQTKALRDRVPEALNRRARDLQQQAQRRIDELRQQAYRARLQSLERRNAGEPAADAETLAAGRKLREELLIDLEIALDLPTPDGYLEARRRRQLERLQSRFKTGDAPRPPAAEELLARWYAVNAGPDPALERRVSAVVDKLLAQHTGSARP